MVDRFLINKDNYIFISKFNENIFFSLNEEEQIKKISVMLNNSFEIVVSFDLNSEEIEKFILLYDKLLNKKNNDRYIVIDLSKEEDENIKKYGNILKELEKKTGCLFMYKYNTYATANIDEILDAINFIENQAHIIKHYNLSPIETLIFIFDMVRDREYIKEGAEEFLDISRNLSKVINSSKIVCAGYANIFSAIANKVGIYTENFIWHNENSCFNGHVSNICYVNDPVYDIHGVFEIDATKGRKKSKDDISFLNRYLSFGNSINDVERINKNNGFVYMGNVKNLFYQILSQYQKYILGFDETNKYMYKCNVLNLINKIKIYVKVVGLEINCWCEVENLIKNGEDKFIVRKKIDYLFEDLKKSFYNLEIDYYDFMVMIYKVKRVEHSLDKDKYLLSLEQIYNIMCNCYNEQDDKIIFYLNFIMNLIDNGVFNFCGEDYSLLDLEKEMLNLDIYRMKLISTLRKIKKIKDT